MLTIKIWVILQVHNFQIQRQSTKNTERMKSLITLRPYWRIYIRLLTFLKYFESMIFDITFPSVISWKDINSSYIWGFLCVISSNQPFFESAAFPRWKIRYESSICFMFFMYWMLSKNSRIYWNLEIVRNNYIVKTLSIM